MSRLGKRPILLPAGVSVELHPDFASIRGPKGAQNIRLPKEVLVKNEKVKDVEALVCSATNAARRARMFLGMVRSLLSNAVKGVSEGFSVDMKMEGVGYRAALAGQTLKLQIGFSHEVIFSLPDDVRVSTKSPTEFSVFGHCLQKVGQVVSDLQALRAPEPYKGKGIHRVGQYVLRKEGKKK